MVELNEAGIRHGALRGRIPGYKIPQARALRAFFAAPQLWTLRDTGALRLFFGEPRENSFTVDADGTRILLWFDRAADSGGVDGLYWPDFAGRARVLAWSLTNEPHLMALSEALGVALLPVTDDTAPVPHDPDGIWLDFAIEDGGYEDVPLSVRASGGMRVPAGWLERLLAKADPPYDDEPLPLGNWNRLASTVKLVLPGPTLRPDEWQNLRPGDVLVVGNRQRLSMAEVHASGRAWPVAAVPKGWSVQGEYRELIPETATMTDPQDGADMLAEDDTPRPPTAHNLPVQVEFELGRMQMTVGELSALQPGFVFTLPTQVEGANVHILANGQRMGRGELVAVGDTLGIRLVSWS